MFHAGAKLHSLEQINAAQSECSSLAIADFIDFSDP
jgi:hypothetical protein